LKSTLKNSHKTQPRGNNRGRSKEIMDRPGQRGKKTPQDLELEGHQNKKFATWEEKARNCTPKHDLKVLTMGSKSALHTQKERTSKL